MDAETREAFDEAIRAGERAHILTIGSPERTALRVTLGHCDRHGRWHPLLPDVFIIWRGCRRSLAELRERARESAWSTAANLLPKKLAYWATIRVGVHATTGAYSDTVVPEMPFTDALTRWEV